MKDVRVFIASVDDWKCMYVNGTAMLQGHSLSLGEVLKTLDGCNISYAGSHYFKKCNEDELDTFGNMFPGKLSDLLFYEPVL